MSVKFERDVVVEKAQSVMSGAESGHIPGTSGKHPIAEAVGTAITGGLRNAGTKGYLAVRDHTLSCCPPTPLLTAGVPG